MSYVPKRFESCHSQLMHDSIAPEVLKG